MLAWLTQNGLLAQAAGTAAEAAQVNEPPIPVVVVTGVVLVFAILVLLFLILQLEGRIFTSIDRKKGQKKQPLQTDSLAGVLAAPAPKLQSGISPEVVAAIAAAVAASSGGAYTLRSVKTVKKGRGSWGFAGVIQSTEPF